jgi:hypothetical protein
MVHLSILVRAVTIKEAIIETRLLSFLDGDVPV